MEVLVESPCSMGMLIPVETVEGRWSKHKTRGVSKNWVYPQCMASFLDVYLEKMVINDQFGGVPPFFRQTQMLHDVICHDSVEIQSSIPSLVGFYAPSFVVSTGGTQLD